MPNPNRPYRAINLRSRKEKDKRNIAAAKSAPYGGDVIIKSKNKISSPTNSSKTLPRGAQVSFRNVNQVTKKPDVVTPAKEYKVTKTTPEKKIFVAGDHNPPGKPTIDRPTTPSLGKALKESPPKTQTRMTAQSKEQPSYDYKGKKEYSGRFETIPAKTVTQKKTVPSLKMAGESYSVPKNQVIVKRPTANPDEGITRSRVAKHVKWLGTRKTTKGLTAKPSTGGKTKTIWKKSPSRVKSK
jgi:hypothetical protein